MNTETLIEINPYDVKFLIHRQRELARFKLLKEAIREIGVRQPLHVRDISGWPAKDRRRTDGGLYKWEAHFGEGRTTACIELYEETEDRRFLQLPAIVKEIPEAEIVGRFLSENLLRRDHTWLDQAKLIRADVERGLTPRQISNRYFITEAHATKLLRVLQALSPRITRQLKGMSLSDATLITTLSAKGQEIVLETLTEGKMDKLQLPALVKKAKRLQETGNLSKSALKASLKRVDEDLSRIRERLKLYRLHHSLGPENLEILLKGKTFRAELDRAGINYNRFQSEVMK